MAMESCVTPCKFRNLSVASALIFKMKAEEEERHILNLPHSSQAPLSAFISQALQGRYAGTHFTGITLKFER